MVCLLEFDNFIVNVWREFVKNFLVAAEFENFPKQKFFQKI